MREMASGELLMGERSCKLCSAKSMVDVLSTGCVSSTCATVQWGKVGSISFEFVTAPQRDIITIICTMF